MQKPIIFILLNIDNIPTNRAKEYLINFKAYLRKNDPDSVYQVIPVQKQETSVHYISTGKIKREDIINFLKKEMKKEDETHE